MPNISLHNTTAGKPTKPMFRDDGSSFACVTLTDGSGWMDVFDTPERIAAIAAAFNGGTVIAAPGRFNPLMLDAVQAQEGTR